jgi:transcriptional regulator with XRE-family HTH domain
MSKNARVIELLNSLWKDGITCQNEARKLVFQATGILVTEAVVYKTWLRARQARLRNLYATLASVTPETAASFVPKPGEELETVRRDLQRWCKANEERRSAVGLHIVRFFNEPSADSLMKARRYLAAYLLDEEIHRSRLCPGATAATLPLEEFGAICREIRTRLRLSLPEFAAVLDLHPQTVGWVEQGRFKLSAEHLLQIFLMDRPEQQRVFRERRNAAKLAERTEYLAEALQQKEAHKRLIREERAIAGPILRGVRMRHQLSQREVGRRLGVPASMVSQWESAIRRPSLVALLWTAKLADPAQAATLRKLAKTTRPPRVPGAGGPSHARKPQPVAEVHAS